MSKSVIIQYFRAAVIMGFFAALVYLSLNNTRTENQINLYSGTLISNAFVQQEVFADPDFALQQLNGIRVQDAQTGKLTYYFEYIANKQDTLRRVESLPFLKDNRLSSLSCDLMDSEINPLDGSVLNQEQRDATSFFWNAKAEEFMFYECYKSPVKHTLLLSKTSDLILHRVEVI